MTGTGKGHAKTGGRAKGTPNKTTAPIRALAAAHGPAMIAQLANLAFHAKLESTQVLAIKELLDRGYGKAAQPVAGDTNGAPIAVTVRWLE